MSEDVDFSIDDIGADDFAMAASTVPSLADRIAADLASRRRKTIEVVHPDAPRWRVVYRLPSDRTELAPFFDRAEKAAKRRQPYQFDAAVLATFNETLTFMGEPLEDGSGVPLTFRDREAMSLLDGATSPSEAVRSLYGSDGIVSAVAEQLLSAAGYGTGDEVQVDDAEDPSHGG